MRRQERRRRRRRAAARGEVRRTLSPVMMAGMSSDRPTMLPLPKAIKDIDSITRAMLEGLSQRISIYSENLENAIFNSPPFEKPNEIERRRNLALCYWLKKDPAYYPRLLPNAKEVLRQLRGEVSTRESTQAAEHPTHHAHLHLALYTLSPPLLTLPSRDQHRTRTCSTS